MAARTRSRWSLCILVAILATGCAPVRGFLNPNPVAPGDPNKPNPNLNPGENPTNSGVIPVDGISGGTVVSAGGTVGAPLALQEPPRAPQMPPPLPPPQPVPPLPIPMPMPRPQPNGPPQPQQPQPQQTQPQPQPLPPGAYYPQQTPFADPHLRVNPTVTGGRMQLQPWETPADRVLELLKQTEVLIAQNHALLARIKELDTAGATREQALAEAAREVDNVTAAAAKERATLQAQIALLQGKIKQMEEEEIQFLEAVIEALKKLLPPEK